MLESQLQSAIIDLAKLTGWKWYHTHDSRRSVPGFPDLVLVHKTNGRIVFAELKAATGRVSPAQEEWLSLLGKRHETYTWWPADWESGLIRDVLTRGAEAAA